VTSILDGRDAAQILLATMRRSPYFVTVKDEFTAPFLRGENIRNVRNVLMAIVNYYEDLHACQTGSLHLNGASCRDHMLTSITDRDPVSFRFTMYLRRVLDSMSHQNIEGWHLDFLLNFS